MAREQVNYEPRAEALGTTVTPNYHEIRPATAEEMLGNDTGAARLAASLGVTSAHLQNTQQNLQHAKLKADEEEKQLQAEKIPFYAAQFKASHEDGSVGQAQLTGMFPDHHPIINAKIAQYLGAEQGRNVANQINDELINNSALNLDPVKRPAYVQQRMQEEFTKASQNNPDNDFYGAGFAQGSTEFMDRFNQQNQVENLKYKTDIQKKGFSTDIANNLLYKQGQNLESIDSSASTTTSLNNIERNDLVVKTAIETAFAHGDAGILNNVPDRFMNAESKNAFAEARIKIASYSWSQYAHKETLATDQLQKTVREGKTQIMQDMIDGKPMDIRGWATKSADLGVFAQQQANADKVPDSLSAQEALSFKTDAMTGATFGDGSSQEDLVNAIQSNTKMNNKDKVKLIGEVPHIQEGIRIVKDPSVLDASSQVSRNIQNALANPMGKSQSMTGGVNVESTVVDGFNRDVRNRFNSYFEDHQKYPVGNAKDDIVDKAKENAYKETERLTKFGSGDSKPAEGSSNRTRSPTPTDNTLPNGVTYKKL